MKRIIAREQYDGTLDDEGRRLQPIWTLPRTPENYDAMVEQASEYIWLKFQQNYPHGPELPSWENCAPLAKMNTSSYARAALQAIGITRPAKTRK